MAEITLVRTADTIISESDKQAARNVMFGIVDGLGDKGKKQWRRFISSLLRLEPGEMVEIHTHQQRLGWFHRKHMALEQSVFESQERFESFDAFRNWLKVGSGFCDWYPGPKGGVIPVPRSISYAKLEQGEMEKVHGNMVDFLRTPHACKTMWPHLQPVQQGEMIEIVLAGFGE